MSQAPHWLICLHSNLRPTEWRNRWRCNVAEPQGADDTAGLTLQEAGHVLQLRDVVLPVAAVFLQQGEDPVVLTTSVSRIQSLQLLEHCAPCGLFLLRVLHPGDGLAAGTKTRVYCITVCVRLLQLMLQLMMQRNWVYSLSKSFESPNTNP